LREQHEHLFYTAFEMAQTGYEAVFRPMTLKETQVVTEAGPAMPPLDMNDWIAERCTLYLSNAMDLHPANFICSVFCPAALPDLLAEQILGVSGFESQQKYVDLLNQSRQEMQTVQANIETFICAAFPGTKPRDVGNMDIYEQMSMLARAETMLGRQLDLAPETTKKRGQRLSPEAAAILAQGAADIPDPDVDNQVMDPFLTGPERMGSLDPMREIKQRMRPKLPGAP
jgi:hypothetical protein